MEEKACHRCRTTKPISEFYLDRTKPSGRTAHCKECHKRTHTVPCAGPCGGVVCINPVRGSLPVGEAMCHSCRRTRTFPCEVCGRPVPKNINYQARSCGGDCTEELRRRGRHPCWECGRPGVSTSPTRRCSDCADERRRILGRGQTHKQRAKVYGRKYVPIKAIEIYERDRWVCQICKRRVPKDKKVPHPLAPTLDHIIPMSCEGGDHVHENVRLAHFRCNIRRGVGNADEAVQLLLVG